MYRHHFGLVEKPFRVVPSPRFLFASETHDESRARILYGIRDSRGFVVVYGGIGLGKTTVLLSVLEELEEKVRTALVFNPVADFHQLLKMVGHEFGLDVAGKDEVDLLHELNHFLVERLAEGETCVLLIDEAQNLSLPLLEQLRTLSNLQSEDRSLLQIVLVGQPELYDRLQDPRLVQLRQRIGVWHEIQPLDPGETIDYIHHRLRLAGAMRPGQILPEATCRRVHAISGGIPRLVNQLCDTALVIAYGRDETRVSEEHVMESARELRLTGAPAVPRQGRSSDSIPERPVAPVPGPAGRAGRRWVVGALLAVLLLALVGWLWWGGRLPLEATSPAGAGGGPGEALAEAPAAVETATATPPQDGPGMRPAASGSFFSVHLASFRTLEQARRFAGDWQGRGDAPELVVYVEETAEQPPWYRVLLGRWPSRDPAREASRQIRSLPGVRYAQLVRMQARDGHLWEFGLGPGEAEG